MKTYFVDTNYLLRYLLNDIPKQSAIAESYLSKADNGEIKIIVLPVCIFEIEHIIRKTIQQGKASALEKIGLILEVPCLIFEEKEVMFTAVDLYGKYNIDLVDAYLYTKAHNASAEVLSFDRDFGKLASGQTRMK